MSRMVMVAPLLRWLFSGTSGVPGVPKWNMEKHERANLGGTVGICQTSSEVGAMKIHEALAVQVSLWQAWQRRRRPSRSCLETVWHVLARTE